MQAFSKQNSRQISVVAGISYLVTHFTSVLAALLIVDGATHNGIRAGVLLELILAIAIVVSGICVQLLLVEQSPLLARTFSSLRLLEAAVICAGTLPLVAWGAHPDLDLAVALSIHSAAFMIGQSLVISVNTIVLGVLLMRTKAVPRWIAALGFVGGFIVLLSNLAQFWGILTNLSIAALCALPVFAFEISFAVYLIVRGVKEVTPEINFRN